MNFGFSTLRFFSQIDYKNGLRLGARSAPEYNEKRTIFFSTYFVSHIELKFSMWNAIYILYKYT